MAGAVGFEPTVHEIKTDALPLGYAPLIIELHYLKFNFKHFRTTNPVQFIISLSKPNEIFVIKNIT